GGELCLGGADGGGEVRAGGVPGDVGVARRVYCDAAGKVIAAAAQVGGVDQDGVDYQPPRLVVASHSEAYLTSPPHHVPPPDRFPPPLCLLIQHRLVERNLLAALRQPHHQIAAAIHTYAARPLQLQPDQTRVRSWRHHEVIFEAPLVAVIDQVHAGVDLPVLDARVVGDVGAPGGGIVADEIVAATRQLLASFRRGGARAE